MTKEDFIKTAYQYFPRSIDSISQIQLYMISPEFVKLANLCSLMDDKQENGDFDGFYNKIKSIDTSRYFHVVQRFVSNDRCHNLQFAELKDNIQYSICLNVSTIIPYYTTYVVEWDIIEKLTEPVDFFRMTSKRPVKSTQIEKEHKQIMDKMAQMAESEFGVKPFPKELLNTVIPDITIETIGLANFTFFNAFFLDDYHVLL